MLVLVALDKFAPLLGGAVETGQTVPRILTGRNIRRTNHCLTICHAVLSAVR